MKALLGAFIFVALCAVAHAQESSLEAEAAWGRLSDEHIECSEFYSVVMVCEEKANDKSLAERARRLQDTMLERTVRITAKAKMKFETIDARGKLSRDSMLAEIGKDCRNLSILLAKYGEACRSLFENPKLR